MAKTARRGGGRKKRGAKADGGGGQAAAKPPAPAPRARGRPAKVKAPIEAEAPVAADSPGARRKISKQTAKAAPPPAPVREAPTAMAVKTVAETPVREAPTAVAVKTVAEASVREASLAMAAGAEALVDLRERVEGGQRELLGRTRGILSAVEATAARVALYGDELSAVQRRLEAIDESLKALARAQQPADPRQALAELHELLRARPRKERANGGTASPARLPGRRGRRAQGEHPNLYTAEKGAAKEEALPPTAAPEPEPEPAAPVSPLPLVEARAALGGRELDFAAPPPLFEKAAEKRDFF